MSEPRPDTEALVEELRHTIEGGFVAEARAALTALAERIAELERERDILFKGDWAALNLRAQMAEARIAELERGAPTLLRAETVALAERNRADAAEAKLAEAEAVLARARLIAARALRSLQGER